MRHLASRDLQCPERDLLVQEDGAYAYGTEGCSMDVDRVTAWGCGREALYDFDAQGAPRLKLTLPGKPELRQWVEEALQAQPPDTAFTLGKSTTGPHFRQQEVLFFPTQSGARWKLAVVLSAEGCSEAGTSESVTPQPVPEATDGSISLWASTCGEVYRATVTYSGPPALMPAPRGLHLRQLAEAVAAKLSESNRPRPRGPTPAPAPARAPAR